MPRRTGRKRAGATLAQIMDAYLDERRQELLDVLATAAALVARADGRCDPVEGAQLADFLDRQDFLSVFSRTEISEAFDHHSHALMRPASIAQAVARLSPHAGRPLAHVLIELGEEVAGADCRLDPREQSVLHLMRSLLTATPSTAGRVGRRGMAD
jgi:tellurite resistance protein